MAKYNSIRVSESAKSDIKTLSSRAGKSEVEYASKMIKFIAKTGIDVYSDALPSIPDLIKNLDQRIVSFLKKREQDFFIPMDKSFKKMIQLHNRTFQSLETLDVVNYSSEPKKLMVPDEQKTALKLPQNQVEKQEENITLKSSQNHVEKHEDFNGFSQDEKEEILTQLERANKERNTYEKELKFLLDNLKPSKSISGPKFVCNISNRDVERIKVLVGDN